MNKKQTFESAMEKLEEIVEKLESGEVPLNEMIKYYEEGSQLISFCLKELEVAEQKIKVLSGDKPNELNDVTEKNN